MNAAVIKKCGVPPVYEKFEEPVAGNGQVLIKVTASPITPLDLLCASGTSYWGSPNVPYIPGVQGVGRVMDTSDFDSRRSYWFQTNAGMAKGNGAMAEYVIVERDKLLEVPDELDDVTSASLGLSAVAAFGALNRAQLQAGEKVLVLGANGVVGQVAVQLARLMGASRVIAGARTKKGRDLVSSLGADATVDTSAITDDLEADQIFRDACDGSVDVVIDPICGPSATVAIRTLSPGGRFVNLGSAASELATFDSSTIRSRSLSILGYTNVTLSPEQVVSHMNEIFNYAISDNLRVEHEISDMSSVKTSWERQRLGEAKGRIILVPNS